METRTLKWMPLVTLIIGALIGSGGIWQLQHARIEQEKLKLERMAKTVELREMVSEKLLEVIGLIKSSDLRKPESLQKYKLMEDDLLEYEKKLAELENRIPRTFKYRDLLPPSSLSAPKGVKYL